MTGVTVDRFRSLPGGLLGRVWPAERIVLGLRVCKWLHAELLSQADRALLAGPQEHARSLE
eukprot:272682-Rhodomonas_salina.5